MIVRVVVMMMIMRLIMNVMMSVVMFFGRIDVAAELVVLVGNIFSGEIPNNNPRSHARYDHARDDAYPGDNGREVLHVEKCD